MNILTIWTRSKSKAQHSTTDNTEKYFGLSKVHKAQKGNVTFTVGQFHSL